MTRTMLVAGRWHDRENVRNVGGPDGSLIKGPCSTGVFQREPTRRGDHSKTSVWEARNTGVAGIRGQRVVRDGYNRSRGKVGLCLYRVLAL